MSENQDGTQSRWLAPPIQIAATALAGITAAFVGSMLGVYGTVLGAGLASGITTVGASLYERSLQHTKEKVREGADKMPLNRARRQPAGSAQRTQVISPLGDRAGSSNDPPTVKFGPVGAAAVAGGGPGSPGKSRRARWLLVAGTAAVGFVIAMLVVTGVETVHGQALSGGNGTSISGFFQRHGSSGKAPDHGSTRQQRPSDETPSGQQQLPQEQDGQNQVPQRQDQPPQQEQQSPGDPQQSRQERPPQQDGQGEQSQQQETPSQQNEQDQPEQQDQQQQQDDSPQEQQQDHAQQRDSSGSDE